MRVVPAEKTDIMNITSTALPRVPMTLSTRSPNASRTSEYRA